MFYLIRAASAAGGQRTIAETYDRAAMLIDRGWELTTRERYMALWMIADADRADRVEQLRAAVRCVPLLEQEMGGHHV